MAIPRKVDVNGRSYRVRRLSRKKMGPDNGWCDHDTATIAVANDLPAAVAYEIFIHEVAHAACWCSGFNQYLETVVPDEKTRDAIEEQAIMTWFPTHRAALKGTR